MLNIEKADEITLEEVETPVCVIAAEETVDSAETENLPQTIELSEEEKAAAARDLKLKIEGILFASEKPITPKQLHNLFPESEAPSVPEIREALAELEKDYEDRGVHLLEVASGYCFRATSLIAPYVGEMMGEKTPKYSRAFLETLAIIAYRQPITRGEIEQIRGVAVNSQVLKTLQEREWVKEVGHKEVPGRPALLATTKEFLDYFHLKQLSDLPPLSELLSENAQMEQAEERITLALQEAETSTQEPAEVPASDMLEESEAVSEDLLESSEVSDEDLLEDSAKELASEMLEASEAVPEDVLESSETAEENLLEDSVEELASEMSEASEDILESSEVSEVDQEVHLA